MYRAKLPAFNADASLAESADHYRATAPRTGDAAGGRVVPSMRAQSPMCRYLGARCAGGDGQACVWYFNEGC